MLLFILLFRMLCASGTDGSEFARNLWIVLSDVFRRQTQRPLKRLNVRTQLGTQAPIKVDFRQLTADPENSIPLGGSIDVQQYSETLFVYKHRNISRFLHTKYFGSLFFAGFPNVYGGRYFGPVTCTRDCAVFDD